MRYEVVVSTVEAFVWLDVDREIKVARGPTKNPRVTFVCDTKFGFVVYSGRDVDRESIVFLDSRLTAAARARRGDRVALAVAF